MSNQISFDDYQKEWLSEIIAGKPSTIDLGNRFSRKLITQWLDLDESSDDVVYCDGTGDGGIDIACLHRGDTADDGSNEGDTWYLVQSKYGSAFSGTGTLLKEAQKIIDTLDEKRPNLSSLAQGLLERLQVFRKSSSEQDKLVLVFATVEPLNDEQKRALSDIRAMGRERLGAIFDVESVSVSTIYNRNLENANAILRIRIPINAQLVPSDAGLLVGSIKLMEMFSFLKSYRNSTGDLDQLYEKNVRRFLGARGKVNKAIQATLENEPELFGLFNNGITIVVEDFKPLENDTYELIEPYIVNGCQTTRTIWEVMFKKLEAGGTGENSTLEKWKARAERGMIIVKIVKVGFQGEILLTQITRFTNSQNAVREKDFIALTSDFQTWAKHMSDEHGLYLEIQRGGWDSRKAFQKQNPAEKQFKEWINAFDLLKVYGAGWLGEAGQAFGKNPPFLPNGLIFKRIVDNSDDTVPFGLDDLYAAYLLHNATDHYQFGRSAKKDSRRQTKFLFYMLVIELLKYVMIDAQIERNNHNITQTLLKLFKNPEAKEALMENAIQALDEYFTYGADDSVFTEPSFLTKYGSNINAFLKWEQLGKSDESSPKFRGILHGYHRAMKRRSAGQDSPSPHEIILAAIKAP